jgi:hypothetical protein
MHILQLGILSVCTFPYTLEFTAVVTTVVTVTVTDTDTLVKIFPFATTVQQLCRYSSNSQHSSSSKTETQTYRQT